MNNNNMEISKNSKAKWYILIITILLIVIIGILIYFVFVKKSNVETLDTNQQMNENKNNEQTNNMVNNASNSNTNNYSKDKIYDKEGPFLLYVEDAYTIQDKGTIVTGQIVRGVVNVGDEVQIIGLNKEEITTTVKGIEMFRKSLDSAEARDIVGINLSDISTKDVKRGQVLAAPNSVTSKTKFEADVYIYSEDEGGRNNAFFTGYRPEFQFGMSSSTIKGLITIPEGTKLILPGNGTNISVELYSSIPLDSGISFSIMEGGKEVAIGTITKTY